MKNPADVLIRPMMTEKSHLLAEGAPIVVFEVARDANKIEIRRAFETIYKSKVEDVRTMNIDGKMRRMGKHMGRKSAWKKAVIQLRAGEKVPDFVEG
jgi:large subunit ribosomal protein L23